MLGTLLKPDYEKLIRDKDWKALRSEFAQLDPPDLAEILEEFPLHDSAVVFRILPRDSAAVIFEYLALDLQTKLVQSLADEQLVNLLNGMAPDDRTRLFEELPPEVTKRALASLTPSELKIARQLLGYPENSAGRHMTPEYVAVRWAHEHGVPVECIDLPAAVSRDVTPSSVASAPRPGVADALADLLGAQASVDSWDLLVESRGAGADPEAVRVAALAAGWALRADHRPDEDAENELREARMRTCLRAFDPGVVAVVGAFHAPALTTGMLADPAVEAADELLLQRFPADRNPVASLVPYGSAELDTRSGYPAGIADPAALARE